MDSLIKKIIENFHQALKDENVDRERSGGLRFSQIQLTILGQFSLIADSDERRQLPIIATLNFDATLKGESIARTMLKQVL